MFHRQILDGSRSEHRQNETETKERRKNKPRVQDKTKRTINCNHNNRTVPGM